MEWLESLNSKTYRLSGLVFDVIQEAKDVVKAFDSLKMVKTASSDAPALDISVDPELASKVKINLSLMRRNDNLRDGSYQTDSVREAKVDDLPKLSTDEENFKEDTIVLPSRKTADSNYLGLVVFQKPESKAYAVSVYLMDSYLGRYALKTNYYFRESSRNAALRAFRNARRIVREVREEISEEGIIQSQLPNTLRRRLLAIEGEIEPTANKTATYLNTNNVKPADTKNSPATYIPNKRPLEQDLELAE